MASINEIAAAAYSVARNAQELQSRLTITKDLVGRDNSQLASITQGSQSGQQAVSQVDSAIKVMETAIKNLELMLRTTDEFISDLQS